jgi:hypothetical protein
MSDDTELARWANELAGALNIDAADIADIPLILDLARDAAHSILRPAAPVTTFLVGYAVGLGRGTTSELAAVASALAAARSAP